MKLKEFFIIKENNIDRRFTYEQLKFVLDEINNYFKKCSLDVSCDDDLGYNTQMLQWHLKHLKRRAGDKLFDPQLSDEHRETIKKLLKNNSKSSEIKNDILKKI